ncbi:MAG: anthranilate phosphoribosyltransferase [Bacteroidetes bacterium]|nr:anthranilate phosphoribosyltransferase [Bacteroidota bacterium]
MIKFYIDKIIEKNDLSIEEAYSAMHKIMDGEISNSQLAAFLVAMKLKGESPEEIAGFAKAMRDKSIKIISQNNNAIDVCGTGGDDSGTFNISTAVSFVVAGAGITVAKHGNRSISSNCGSADVLSELGVNVNLSPQQSEEALNNIGIAFLFAPIYHPAMKHAAQVRKELAMKTIFNLLGPITNPAGTKKQIIGTFHRKAAELLAQASQYLDFENINFISTSNKYDEILLRGITDVFQYKANESIFSYKLTNHDFDMPQADLSSLIGGDSKINAGIILDIIRNKKRNSAFNVVVANAALAIKTAGISDNLLKCKKLAEESILSGKAFSKLNELRKFGEKYS